MSGLFHSLYSIQRSSMKRALLFLLTFVVAVACYDDTDFRNKLNEQDRKIAALESFCDQMKYDIASIQTLLDEMSKGETVSNVTPIMDGDMVIGYTLTFSGGASVDLYIQNDVKPTESIFKDIELLTEYVVLTLVDGTVIELPLRSCLVKDYYVEEIEKTKADLRELMTEPCIVFPMITDIHYLATTSDSPRLIDNSISNMLEISKDIRFDFLACLGDLTQGNKPMEETEAEAKYVYNQFRRLGIPYYTSIGNHDTNIYYKVGDTYMKDHVFTCSQLYGLYIRDISDVVYDMSSMCGTNYFKDFYEFKTRLVFLNSNEGDTYGFSDETLAWFTQVMDTDYDVYVFSHRKPGTKYHNDVQMNEVMKNSESFRMLFFGHVHYDCEFSAPFTETNPYLAFAQRCNKCYQQNFGESWPSQAVLAERKVGTASEDCFDVVVIRPQSQRVNLVRFGGGVDREFNLVTGMSVGESANQAPPEDDVTVTLDFSTGWPFAESCASVDSQFNNGEEYTHVFSYEVDGVKNNKEVRFAVSRGKVAGYSYSYVAPSEGGTDGRLVFDNYEDSSSGNTFGLLSIPYIDGLYLKSVSVVHVSSTSSQRFNIQKGWLTPSEYSEAEYVKKNTIKTWTFPLASNVGTIAPDTGTSTSSLRDYAVRMRSNNISLKKVSFVYTKTKPE